VRVRLQADEQTKRLQDALVPKYNARRKEFIYRIKYLGLEIEQAEETRIKTIAERSRLSHEMAAFQNRLVLFPWDKPLHPLALIDCRWDHSESPLEPHYVCKRSTLTVKCRERNPDAEPSPHPPPG
jgi:hypothetical protein